MQLGKLNTFQARHRVSTHAPNPILAWSEDQVERIIRRSVGHAAATKEAIRLLNDATKERT